MKKRFTVMLDEETIALIKANKASPIKKRALIGKMLNATFTQINACWGPNQTILINFKIEVLKDEN